MVNFVQSIGYDSFRGSEDNVLDRYYKAALKFRGNTIIRITGDCPLVDAGLIDKMLGQFKSNSTNFFWNDGPPTFPDGLDVEIFDFPTFGIYLEKVNQRI